ncbi:MAG: hypothetical protein H6807_17930 [Planctomycetes bacterium]|nr:hypothetical protein [Planctomycetota bacterium]
MRKIPLASSRPWLVIAGLLLTLACGRLQAQASFTQTLPPGYLDTPGGSSTSYPFTTTSDQTWQWLYDSSAFVHQGPLQINQIWVRLASPTLSAGNFLFGGLEVTLIEAAVPHNAPSATFANNILRSEIVHTGVFVDNNIDTTGNGTVGGWIPLLLTSSFSYDPSKGNDLIIQLRSCVAANIFGWSIDYAFSTLAHRIGNLSDCAATTQDHANANGAPVVKIDYTPIKHQTLPDGFMASVGNGSTGLPFNTANDSTWQWHYDSAEFQAGGPITITNLAVRPYSPSAPIAAFEFTDLQVTLIEASTDYRVGSHDPIFANNVLRSELVRAGPYRGEAMPGPGGAIGNWVGLQLQNAFVYDPTTGHDLIVELRVCGPVTTFGTSLDGVVGLGIGGNRYGNTTSCTATADNFNNDEYVPIVLLSYVDNEVVDYPYLETFDRHRPAQSTALLPFGWESDSWALKARTSSSGTANWDYESMRAGVGRYVTLDDSQFNSAVGDDLYSPILDLATLGNPVLKFRLYSWSVLDPSLLDENRLRVDLIVHGSGGGTSVVNGILNNLSVQKAACWNEYGIDLSPWSGQRVQVRFNATSDSANGFYHDFAIDHFEVAEKTPSENGQSARSQVWMDINDCANINGLHVDDLGTGPYYTCGRPAGDLDITIQGPASFQPAALWIGPLNIQVATYGVLGQIDTGTPDTNADGIPENLLLLGSGLNPTPSFFDYFFFTDATGRLDLSLQLSPVFPLGVLGTFQAAAADGIGGIYLTNAVVLEIVP